MQQDRRHLMRRTDRRTSRDTLRHTSCHMLANRPPAPTRHGPGKSFPDVIRRRGLGAWRVPPRAALLSGDAAAYARQGADARCSRSTRGAALLDVMFTLTTLMAGAQGFAHWQAAGGMTSTELTASPKVVAMPSLALDDTRQGRDAP